MIGVARTSACSVIASYFIQLSYLQLIDARPDWKKAVPRDWYSGSGNDGRDSGGTYSLFDTVYKAIRIQIKEEILKR